jgi:hypothetical protein
MSYSVRVYCHESWEKGTCQHVPVHPYILREKFDSIRAANDHGDKVVGTPRDDGIEWEVIDERGEIVC